MENNEIDIDEALGGFEQDEAEAQIAKAHQTVNANVPAEGRDFLSRYVEPHKVRSREVVESDLPRVLEEAHVLFQLCYTYHGLHAGGFAVAHPQIDDKEPLRFFVTAEQEIVINPEITNHTSTKVDHKEGCLSFPGLYPIVVQRWNKCEVRYQTLTPEGKLSEFTNEPLTGRRARIFQHEIDHFDGKYIYDK